MDAVVLHALEKDKFARFQSAAEFRSALEAAVAGEVLVKKAPKDDFNATLFGVNPSARAGTDATMRQLSNSADDRVVRTQSRPPVAWIWAGIAVMAVILGGLTFWVLNLQPTQIGVDLSVDVPNVVGMTYEAGAQKLSDLHLVPNRLGEPSDTVPEGAITRVEPVAGTRVAKNYPVKVWVSTGRSIVAIPLVTNQTQKAAIKTLTEAGFVYGSTKTCHSPSVPKGVVMGTNPEGGTQARLGTTIDLLVSDGLVDVPKVVGLSIGDANRKLSPLGLNINPVADDTCTGGVVTGQSLAPGPQPQRSSISLTYCSGV
jgi:serine/threonine-protein kinase